MFRKTITSEVSFLVFVRGGSVMVGMMKATECEIFNECLCAKILEEIFPEMEVEIGTLCTIKLLSVATEVVPETLMQTEILGFNKESHGPQYINYIDLYISN